MLFFILWYIVIGLAGLVTFPLAYRLLPALPDRGYSLSRALGLLLWGYLLWLLVSLGILRNDLGGVLFALVLVLLTGWFALRLAAPKEVWSWLQAHRVLIAVEEGFFLLAFAGMAVVRSSNPEIFGTEKPMELAFINSILRSPTFPPHDPWLSGYGISYYYFGYVLVAMLARVTGVPGSVAFNLGIALVFAMTALGAYGLVYDLLRSGIQKNSVEGAKQGSPLYYALLGPLFILLVSNLEGFLEVLHHLGLFWTSGPGGQLTSRFWTWLGILDLNQPPSQPFTWLPRDFGTGSWWWWRASRVIMDYDFLNRWKGDVINEFPAFSFLLSDLHPHVLSMPFFLLAVGLALNLFLGGSRGKLRVFSFELNLSPAAFSLAAFALGSLAFLNTWDILPVVALFAGAYAFRNFLFKEDSKPDASPGDKVEDIAISPSPSAAYPIFQWVIDFIVMAACLAIASFVLYLPFFLGFSSQAGGPLPNLAYITRGAQIWVMFAPLWMPIGAYLAYLWFSNKKAGSLLKGVILALGIALALWFASLVLVGIISQLSFLSGVSPLANSAAAMFLDNLGAPNFSALFRDSLLRRATNTGAWITLLVLLAATLGLFFWRKKPSGVDEDEHDQVGRVPLNASHSFILLMVLLGTLLVLAPEFIFLRDQFYYRINTIFKFYFQAWQLWALTAAAGTAILLLKLRGAWGFLFRLGTLAVMVMALTYPALAFWDKTHGLSPATGLTLDGAATLQRNDPDQWAAIQWLENAPQGVIVEAVSPNGGDYTDYALVSEYSGQPTVLGWVGHEGQWRGGGTEIGSRRADIEQLYTTNDWNTAQAILKKYDVSYVYIGARERGTYRVNEIKFKRYLETVFQQGEVVIYAY